MVRNGKNWICILKLDKMIRLTFQASPSRDEMRKKHRRCWNFFILKATYQYWLKKKTRMHGVSVLLNSFE